MLLRLRIARQPGHGARARIDPEEVVLLVTVVVLREHEIAVGRVPDEERAQRARDLAVAELGDRAGPQVEDVQLDPARRVRVEGDAIAGVGHLEVVERGQARELLERDALLADGGRHGGMLARGATACRRPSA